MTAIDDVTGAFGVESGRRARPLRLDAAQPRLSAIADVATSPRATATLERRRLWELSYRQRLRVSDSAVVLVAVGAATIPQLPAAALSLLWIPAATAVIWMAALTLFATRDTAIAGDGTTEYKRVAHATGLAFGLIAIVAVLAPSPALSSQVAIALPIGMIGLLSTRWAWRRWLMAQRTRGHFLSRVLVIGRREDVEYVVSTIHDPRHGYVVVGAALDGSSRVDAIRIDSHIVPVMGDMNTVAMAAAQISADAIVVASRPDADPDYIKRLSWELEGTAAELVLSSRLADVAGPRISLRQIDGLPLIRVKIPTFEGGRHVAKRAFDVAVAGAALLALVPVFAIIALAVRIDSGGPVFFRQQRVGKDGRLFSMVKFRSMKVDAEAELEKLRALNEGAGPLFKMKADPRVTRVGRVLRKYSLDELPQFWNVFVGDMSVVGPRPPLPDEATSYDGDAGRRLYIKPGITGLWQVSGRSDLSWEESVRLDLRYVENWSLTDDLAIMWRTVRVMIAPQGAY